MLSTVDTFALSEKRVVQDIFRIEVKFHEVLDNMCVEKK